MRIPGIAFNKPSDWVTGKAINLDIGEQGITLRREMKYSASGRFPVIAPGVPIHAIAAERNGKLYMMDNRGAVFLLDPAYPAPELLLAATYREHMSESLLLGTTERFAILPLHPRQAMISVYAAINGQCLWQVNVSVVDGESVQTLAAAHESEQLHLLQRRRTIPLQEDEAESDGQPIWNYELHSYNWNGRLLRSRSLPNHLANAKGNADHPARDRDRWKMAVYGETIYVAAPNSSTIWSWNEAGEPSGFSLVGYRLEGDMSEGPDGAIYAGVHDLRSANEMAAYLIVISPQGDWERVPGYTGRVDELLRSGEQLLVHDASAAIMTIFRRNRMIRSPLETDGLPRGHLLLPSADSGTEGNMWHNLRIDADVPPETRLIVHYYAADHMQIQWRNRVYTIDEWLHAPEIGNRQRLHYIHEHWQALPLNPLNALFPEARGRYLWVALELSGSWTQAPLVRELELFYPRTSLLHYLPELYQEQGEQSFLGRFLALFGHFFRELHQQIDEMPYRFDPELIEGDFLRWVAGWVGIAADESWDDDLLRRYLHRMPGLYRIRGTREAMVQTMELMTGKRPYVLEHFQYKHLLHDPDWNEALKPLYNDMPYSFLVLVPPDTVHSERQKEMLQRMLHEEKPVMTEAELVVLEPRIRLGAHTYLEINSVLSRPSRMSIDEQSVVSYDTVLTDGGETAAATFPFRLDEAIKLEH
ncbi:phage tail protein [Paenibacillus campi]|uniref:phage tail protein n=1 Tax=Paenibacillus campi TaxID=3106031 RepID=UPI002AFFB6EF|nr:phage tail protein [Paenibacillus sp. SGZ-1014]